MCGIITLGNLCSIGNYRASMSMRSEHTQRDSHVSTFVELMVTGCKLQVRTQSEILNGPMD
jgi:hypothetical protein